MSHPGAALMLAVIVLGACNRPGGPARSEIEYQPQQSAIVAVVSATPRFATQLEQLKTVVAEAAMPDQILVLVVTGPGSSSSTYVVQRGDDLSTIARRHGTDLTAVLAANPHLTRLADRDPNLIYKGDLVVIPSPRDPGTRNALMTRSPSGPPRPRLTMLAPLGSDGTEYQAKKWRNDKAAIDGANSAAIAKWRADAKPAIDAWTADVLRRIDQLKMDGPTRPAAESASALTLASVLRQSAATLHGLSGRRVLVLMDTGEAAPPESALADPALAGVELFVANLDRPDLIASWRSTATASASKTVLDSAGTTLRLATLISAK